MPIDRIERPHAAGLQLLAAAGPRSARELGAKALAPDIVAHAAARSPAVAVARILSLMCKPEKSPAKNKTKKYPRTCGLNRQGRVEVSWSGLHRPGSGLQERRVHRWRRYARAYPGAR